MNVGIRCFLLLTATILASISLTHAQQASVSGHRCGGRVWLRTGTAGQLDSVPAAAASVQSASGDATTTDSSGRFQLGANAPPKELIIRSVGYQTLRVPLGEGGCQGLSLTLLPAVVQLQGIHIETSIEVSSGAPAEVKSIDARRLEQVNATSLGDALPYTPGVQVENSCQTCGYTQVRLNGLAGPYTQILMDGQSIMGGLNAAYGLDHLPTALIERIEVLRGGGSAAYAANAVGGVVNVVTRRAQEQGWGAVQQSSIVPKGGGGDHLWRAHADWVSRPKPTSGQDKRAERPAPANATAFINHRLRTPYDHDGDGFSEVARLRGTSVGLLMEKRLSNTWRLRLNNLAIEEERRGGSDWHVPAPQARLSEEILQRSIATQLEANHRNERTKRETQFYLAQQSAQRKAYYGGAGDSIPMPHPRSRGLLGSMGEWSPWNAPHTAAYGRSTEGIIQAGFRVNAEPLAGWRLLAGSEMNHRNLVDALPQVERSISQQFLTWSRFVQVDGEPLPSWRIHLGWRNDGVRLTGSFQQDTSSVPVFYTGNPGIWRGSVRWQPIGSRLSMSIVRSGGYRAPQIFTEDLHVELVGGSVRSIRWSPELREERSVGYSFSAEYALGADETRCTITAEAFYTQLKRPMLLNDLESEFDGGASIWQKSNGPDARILGVVMGLIGATSGSDWQWDASFSIQKAQYASEVRLASGLDGELRSREVLRLPNCTGYLTLRRSLGKGWWMQYNQILSGAMWTTRTDAQTTGELMLIRSPALGQHDLWIEKIWKISPRLRLATETACQNLLNNYQKDLSVGSERDASYLYGPSMPRRISVRLRLMG